MDTPEIKTSSGKMYSLVVLYDAQTKLLHSSLQNISNEDAQNGHDTSANHIAWLTGSMVQDRQEIAWASGSDYKPELGKFFKDQDGAQAWGKSPSEFEIDLYASNPVPQESNPNVTDEEPNSPFEVPDMAMSFFDLIAFIIYREANTVGQLALWCRLLGHDAMKYE